MQRQSSICSCSFTSRRSNGIPNGWHWKCKIILAFYKLAFAVYFFWGVNNRVLQPRLTSYPVLILCTLVVRGFSDPTGLLPGWGWPGWGCLSSAAPTAEGRAGAWSSGSGASSAASRLLERPRLRLWVPGLERPSPGETLRPPGPGEGGGWGGITGWAQWAEASQRGAKTTTVWGDLSPLTYNETKN